MESTSTSTTFVINSSRGATPKFAQNLASRAIDIGATIANTIFQAFTIGLFTFYLVAEGPKLRRNVCSVLPPDRQREVLRVWDLAIEKTGGYIASRAVLGTISAGSHWLAFVAIGLPSPLPLGLWVGFISQFIPVVGTYLAGALPLLITLIDKPISGLWTLIFLVIYQQIENYFLPRHGAHDEIHVASAFASVIIGAALLGPLGALLALPAAATLQAFISSYVIRHEVDNSALMDVTSKRKRGQKNAPEGGAARAIAQAARALVSAVRAARALVSAVRAARALVSAVRAARALLLDLDLDVDAGGQLEALQRVDGLRRRLDDVEQALVDPHLEVLAAVLVLERPRMTVKRCFSVGSGIGPRPCLGAQHGLDDLLRRLVDDLVVVRLRRIRIR